MPEELVGEHAGAAATDPLGAETAKRVLEKGGNAVDAAVAATLTLSVVRVGATGLGGYGGGLVYFDAVKGKTIAINFDSRAPKAYRDELYANPDVRQHGYLAMSIPANVAGLDLALRKFGTMSWHDVSADAIRFAEEGFEIRHDINVALENWSKVADPTSLKALLPDGKVPAVGDNFKQTDLAKLLKLLVDQGPASFYEGEIPQRIAKQIKAGGGILSEDDFKIEQAHEVAPLQVKYRGYDVYTQPLPAGGLTSLQILKALDRFDFSQMKAWSADVIHLFVEVAKRCWNDRLESLGDPDFVKDPERFLSDARADEIAADVRTGKIYQTKYAPPPGSHTANIVCVDRKHNLCSLTCTHGVSMGAYVVIDSLGLILNNGMSRFIYEGNGPNRAAPLKRVFHNMMPVVITRDGHPIAAIGHTGGPTIPSITTEAIMGLIDFREGPGQIVNSPKLHTDGHEPIQIMDDFPKDVEEALIKRGHTFKHVGYIGGPLQAATVNHSSGEVHAASSLKEQSAAVL